MFKSERREAKRRNSRKMRVEGRSVFVMQEAQRKRDKRRFDQARRMKRMTPVSV